MRVVRGFDGVPDGARGAAFAIGNFDGVHRGHQALIARAIAAGRKAGRPAGAMAFDPHPHRFFKPEAPHFDLTPLPEKLRLFESLGLDLAAILPFDAALAAMSADDFVRRVLVEGYRIGHAVAGYDFQFGARRGGSADTLRAAGEAFGFGVTVVAPVSGGGEVYSSSAIRDALRRGDVAGAAAKLGRFWRVSGPVTGGAKRGGAMGFPTANLALAPGVALAHGTYAVWVLVGEERHAGAAYFGPRPTFDGGPPMLEAFLFDFDGDLYGRDIAVEFVEFIRPDARFETAEALAAQMTRDCERAREILGVKSALQDP